jgi:hypothetical protein
LNATPAGCRPSVSPTTSAAQAAPETEDDRVGPEHPAAEGGTRRWQFACERERGRRHAERLEIRLAAGAELHVPLERPCLLRVERVEHVGRGLVVHHRKYGAS